jgi:hypothetical protein
MSGGTCTGVHRRVASTGKEEMMAHHKRGRPKSTRAGCLLCKPHKRQGAPLRDRQRFNQFRRIVATDEQIAEAAAEASKVCDRKIEVRPFQ